MASEEITMSLRPLEYYRAEVDARLEREGDGFRAVYRVSPGDPVIITRMDLSITVEKSPPGSDPEIPRFGKIRGKLTTHSDGKSSTFYSRRKRAVT